MPEHTPTAPMAAAVVAHSGGRYQPLLYKPEYLERLTAGSIARFRQTKNAADLVFEQWPSEQPDEDLLAQDIVRLPSQQIQALTGTHCRKYLYALTGPTSLLHFVFSHQVEIAQGIFELPQITEGEFVAEEDVLDIFLDVRSQHPPFAISEKDLARGPYDATDYQHFVVSQLVAIPDYDNQSAFIRAFNFDSTQVFNAIKEHVARVLLIAKRAETLYARVDEAVSVGILLTPSLTNRYRGQTDAGGWVISPESRVLRNNESTDAIVDALNMHVNLMCLSSCMAEGQPAKYTDALAYYRAVIPNEADRYTLEDLKQTYFKLSAGSQLSAMMSPNVRRHLLQGLQGVGRLLNEPVTEMLAECELAVLDRFEQVNSNSPEEKTLLQLAEGINAATEYEQLQGIRELLTSDELFAAFSGRSPALLLTAT
jgi:hypothetical protein